MDILFVLLIGIYAVIAWFDQRIKSRVALYSASILHVSLLGWLLSSVPWTNPRCGLVAVSWLVVAAVLWFLEHPKVRSIIPALTSGVALMLTMAILAPTQGSSVEEVQTWISIHLFLILVGYVGCILGGILGGTYIFVSSKLKSRNLKEIRRYPSLTTIAHYNFVTVGFGTMALFSGVAMGVFWALSTDSFHWDATWIMSFGMLLWYSAGLIGRLLGKQARWDAWFSIVGLGSVTIYFVLSSILGSWHLGGMG